MRLCSTGGFILKSRFCNICSRRGSEFCESCQQNDEALNFYPEAYYKDMFYYGSAWSNKDVNIFHWNTTNDVADETRTINIGSHAYCPYCAKEALPLQRDIKRYDDYRVTGYCCLCEGALAESAYKNTELVLLAKHEKELSDLKQQWLPKLKYDVDTLFRLQQTYREKRFNSNKEYCGKSYFTTINGDVPVTVDNLFDLN